MRAFRITDFMLASSIIVEEKIAAAMYEDGGGFTIPDVVNEYWVGVEHEDHVIACYRAHQVYSTFWQGHAAVLPKYRDHSIGATNTALKWCAENIQNFQKFLVCVPAPFQNVFDHCTLVGFEHEGTIKECYMRDGKLVDVHHFTITKAAIEAL
jgi:hypothetical protein